MATEVTPLVRVISGKGTITIPTDFANASDVVLYVDVIREAESVYRNFNTNPPESFFGRFCACVGDYVLYTRQVSFDREMFQLFPGDVSDVMQAVKCLERSIYLGLKAVAIIAGGDIVLPDPYPLDVYEPQGYVPDNFKFVCYGGTALRLTLTAYENENCGDNEFPRKKPPTPPPPPDKVPPGEPVEVDPPEEDFPDDTDPFEGDIEKPPEPPFGEICEGLRVSITYANADPGGTGAGTVDIDVWGVLEDFFIRDSVVPGAKEAVLVCGGQLSVECVQGQEVLLLAGNADLTAEITNIVVLSVP